MNACITASHGCIYACVCAYACVHAHRMRLYVHVHTCIYGGVQQAHSWLLYQLKKCVIPRCMFQNLFWETMKQKKQQYRKVCIKGAGGTLAARETRRYDIVSKKYAPR